MSAYIENPDYNDFSHLSQGEWAADEFIPSNKAKAISYIETISFAAKLLKEGAFMRGAETLYWTFVNFASEVGPDRVFKQGSTDQRNHIEYFISNTYKSFYNNNSFRFESMWRKTVIDGKFLSPDSEAGKKFLLLRVNTQQDIDTTLYFEKIFKTDPPNTMYFEVPYYRSILFPIP